ncbi:MAG: hypothetical protein U0838_05255 [Chloroflexota bacterium]
MAYRSTVRLVLRQHRFALVVLGIAAVLMAIDWAFVAWLHFGPIHACNVAVTQPNLTDAQMVAAAAPCAGLDFILASGSNFVLLSANFAPLFAVLIAAVPLISSEVEFGTATLAWTLARSRRAWLLPRLAFLMLVVLGLGLLAGLVTDALVAEVWIPGSPWASMYAYTGRGALITSRVLLMAAAGVFSGALLGRQMPALMVAGALTLGIVMGISIWDSQMNMANAVPLADGERGWTFDSRIRVLATGELVDWGMLPAEDQDPSAPGWNEHYAFVEVGIPDSQAGAVVGRNVIAYAIPMFLMLGLTFVIVERRKPYLA